MSNKNAMDLIQTVRNYFKEEYGLTIDVQIFAHTDNNSITISEAQNIAGEINRQVNGEVKFGCGEKVNWYQCDNWHKGVKLTFFCEDEPQEAQTC